MSFWEIRSEGFSSWLVHGLKVTLWLVERIVESERTWNPGKVLVDFASNRKPTKKSAKKSAKTKMLMKHELICHMTKNKSAQIKVLSFLDKVSILIFALVRVRPWSYLPNKICLRIGYVIITRVLNERNWTRVSHEVCFVPFTKLRNGLPCFGFCFQR